MIRESKLNTFRELREGVEKTIQALKRHNAVAKDKIKSSVYLKKKDEKFIESEEH